MLTGAGDKAFCAGMDLKAFAAGEPIGAGDGPGTTVFVERCYPKPIIAAVNGAAVAGGFGMMLGCDIIVAAEHATFGLPEVKRGLVGVGATTRASLRLPPAITLELALTGAPMDAARALHYGLVNRVVPAAEVLPDRGRDRDDHRRQRAARGRCSPRRSRSTPAASSTPTSPCWRERAAPVFVEQRRQRGRPRLRREAPPELHRHLSPPNRRQLGGIRPPN